VGGGSAIQQQHSIIAGWEGAVTLRCYRVSLQAARCGGSSDIQQQHKVRGSKMWEAAVMFSNVIAGGKMSERAVTLSDSTA